jgi:hypothetical protein
MAPLFFGPSYSRGCQVGDGGWSHVCIVWWVQIPGPVRTVMVAMLGVFLQNRAQVPRPGNQHPGRDLGPHRADPALGIGIALGLRGGICTTSIPAADSTVSNALVN